jgi:hypothetical protein
MPELSPCGVAVISIDVSSLQGGTTRGAAYSLAAEALQRLNDRQMVATLAFDEVDVSSLEQLDLTSQRHELAILARTVWYSVGNRRSQFSDELSRHILNAQAAGCSPTTLALPAGHLAEHLDLLVKHGISAVRTTRKGASRGFWSWWRGKQDTVAADSQPHSLRWGLWEFDGSLELSRQGLRRVNRTISAAAAASALAHIVVDLALLAGQGAAGWKQFERMLDQVDELRREQTIELLTVAAFVASLTRTRHSPPARSILRPAA